MTYVYFGLGIAMAAMLYYVQDDSYRAPWWMLIAFAVAWPLFMLAAVVLLFYRSYADRERKDDDFDF